MNQVFLISGPSGSGKTTIVNHLTSNRAVTTTSRSPREGEVDGIDYYFVSVEEFIRKINSNEMIEHALYGDNYYGLTRTEYNRRLQEEDLFIVCDYQGMIEHKKNNPEAISMFIYTSFNETKKQLEDRGEKTDAIEKRLSLYKKDMRSIKEYEFIFENSYGNLEKVVENIETTIKKIKRNI